MAGFVLAAIGGGWPLSESTPDLFGCFIGERSPAGLAASIFGGSVENAPQRLFAFELRDKEYAAAGRNCQTRSIAAVRATQILPEMATVGMRCANYPLAC